MAPFLYNMNAYGARQSEGAVESTYHVVRDTEELLDTRQFRVPPRAIRRGAARITSLHHQPPPILRWDAD
jgi:hypothetical protein